MLETKNGVTSSECSRTQVKLDTTKPASNHSTQALADFLQVVGESVADLNTIAVGLAAIHQGHEKPEGLNISWAPKDPVIAARKARKAAVHAAMVVTTEALAQYVRAVTKLPRFGALTAAWNSRTPKTSAAERVSELAQRLFAPDGSEYDKQFRTCCVMLMVHWRNRHVHTDSNAELKHHEKQIVRKYEERIGAEYAGLNVDQLFAHFDTNRPTLKDATTLIAMSIQEVRAIDHAVHICCDAADVHAWLDHYKLTERIDKILRETATSKQRESILRMLRTLAPHIAPWYEKFVSDPTSTATQQ